MVRAHRVVIASFVVLLLGALAWTGVNATAQDSARHTKIISTYTEFEWWLIRWSDNQVLCQILIDHEGLPTLKEVYKLCGKDLTNLWVTTPPCKLVLQKNSAISQCSGLYMHLVSSQEKQREVIVELPPIEVWVNLEGCKPIPPENRCTDIPLLVLRGEEPLPNERIIAINGLYDGEPFSCPGDVCQLPLRPTTMEGSTIEFWADSSYGDSSQHFTAQARVIDTGASPAPGNAGWYVDIISSQWQGAPLTSCAMIWEAFPPVGGPPLWLTTPDRFELLSSDEPYYYLAGRMISRGLVDVSGCPTKGLLPNGYADACGLEKASPLLQEWQNQFDDQIIKVANETGIPAQLMKNLFAQESQFWPGVFRVPYEFGLGQITDNGAETILMWNPSFFAQFCPLVLTEEACAGGYLSLKPKEKAIVRGALALQAKADCKVCPEGIDLNNTKFTISLFANTLLANCSQVSRIIYNHSGSMAGEVASYEDLWRFTIANYHAGPGCLSYAIYQAWADTQSLTWQEVSSYFTEPCQGAVPYVEKITQYP